MPTFAYQHVASANGVHVRTICEVDIIDRERQEKERAGRKEGGRYRIWIWYEYEYEFLQEVLYLEAWQPWRPRVTFSIEFSVFSLSRLTLENRDYHQPLSTLYFQSPSPLKCSLKVVPPQRWVCGRIYTQRSVLKFCSYSILKDSKNCLIFFVSLYVLWWVSLWHLCTCIYNAFWSYSPLTNPIPLTLLLIIVPPYSHVPPQHFCVCVDEP